MNELQVNQENKEVNLFSPQNFNHYFGIAEKIAKTNMVPKNYIGKPMEIVVAMEYGMSLGLGMMQSLQEIAVINGKPCLYGDGMLAVCQGSSKYEGMQEKMLLDESGAIVGASCTVKRVGSESYTKDFTIEQAKKAGLWGKAGVWSQYPDRMLQMRARGFALRDQFADVLRGVKSAEEVQDYEIKDVTPKSKAANIIDNLIGSDKNQSIEASKMASKGQIEHIEQLFDDCDISAERRVKALAMYNCESIKDLEAEQADTLITILTKQGDK